MTTTTFTWDIAAGIPVVLDDGTSRYVYGPSGLIAQKTSADDFYYLADGLGSTMAITDDIGDVVRDYTYDVYGQVTGGSGATPNEFDFAGQQSDDSTGLQYLRARYYDPETGVFISREPLAARPGWLESPSSYAASNPATHADPSGLCVGSVPCPDGIIEVVTGAAEDAVCMVLLHTPCPVPVEPFVTQVLGNVQLVGEYLIIGAVKIDVIKLRHGQIIQKPSKSPLGDSMKDFADLARRNGATISFDPKTSRYYFKTKSQGLEVSWRLGSDPAKTPTIHIQNPGGKGEIKIKYVKAP